MNPAVLLFGFLAGLDNLYACGGVGILPLHRERRHLFALSSCVCELAAPFLGLALGRTLLATLAKVTDRGAPLIVLLCAGGILLSGIRRRNESELVQDVGIFLGLPLSLSLDNLAAGAAISAFGGRVWLSAISVGAISAMMSCIGIYFGRWVGHVLPARRQVLAVGCLFLFAARMLWFRE